MGRPEPRHESMHASEMSVSASKSSSEKIDNEWLGGGGAVRGQLPLFAPPSIHAAGAGHPAAIASPLLAKESAKIMQPFNFKLY